MSKGWCWVGDVTVDGEEIRGSPPGMEKSPVNSGTINYQPQLVSQFSEPSTVAWWSKNNMKWGVVFEKDAELKCFPLKVYSGDMSLRWYNFEMKRLPLHHRKQKKKRLLFLQFMKDTSYTLSMNRDLGLTNPDVLFANIPVGFEFTMGGNQNSMVVNRCHCPKSIPCHTCDTAILKMLNTVAVIFLRLIFFSPGPSHQPERYRYNIIVTLSRWVKILPISKVNKHWS